MTHIRPAIPADASRIAEIIITNYRTNFYPFFRNDAYYFGELNVMDMAAEYAEGTNALQNTYVYDDGVVKGIIRISGDEIQKLFIEPTFQSQGIGAKLLHFAVSEKNASWLWVLEYNKRGIAFYERHGFSLTDEKIMEDEWVPLLKMKRPDRKEHPMKYFVRNQERKNTVYHEFQKGRFDEETFWKEDSLCLHDDYLHTLGLFQIFQNTIPDYSDTGESEIDEKLWNAVMQEAKRSGGEALECLLEADAWVCDTLQEYGVFTIIGV